MHAFSFVLSITNALHQQRSCVLQYRSGDMEPIDKARLIGPGWNPQVWVREKSSQQWAQVPKDASILLGYNTPDERRIVWV